MDRDLKRSARVPRVNKLPEKKRPQMSRLSPFVLNDFVLSLLSLKCPFRLKFAETVCKTKFIGPETPKGSKTPHLALCFSLGLRG